MDKTTTVIVLLVIIILYMLPTLLAYSRQHPRRQELAVVNILLGWTLIGWIGVFLWALLATPEDQPV